MDGRGRVTWWISFPGAVPGIPPSATGRDQVAIARRSWGETTSGNHRSARETTRRTYPGTGGPLAAPLVDRAEGPDTAVTPSGSVINVAPGPTYPITKVCSEDAEAGKDLHPAAPVAATT